MLEMFGECLDAVMSGGDAGTTAVCEFLGHPGQCVLMLAVKGEWDEVVRKACVVLAEAHVEMHKVRQQREQRHEVN
jgi:hypothetical protein